MLQQLLHSYFQKRDKADKQGQKIQHSCCKGKWAPEVDHFHAASLTTHSEAYGGFAALILNIWNHINLHQFNFSVDWILYCIFHYFVWSLHSGFQLWQNNSTPRAVFKNLSKMSITVSGIVWSISVWAGFQGLPI